MLASDEPCVALPNVAGKPGIAQRHLCSRYHARMLEYCPDRLNQRRHFRTTTADQDHVELIAFAPGLTQLHRNPLPILMEELLAASGKNFFRPANSNRATPHSLVELIQRCLHLEGCGYFLLYGRQRVNRPELVGRQPLRLRHHLGLNATFANGDVTLAPSLTGAQPAIFTQNGGEVRPFGAEYDAAFALINLLDASQQRTAIISRDFIDLVLGPGEDGKTIQPEGLAASELTAVQQSALLDLIRTRVGIINETVAAKRMAEIESNLSQTYFAWYGPTSNGSATYWRIQGPTLVIEYSPQPSGGSALNHTHAIYRDPTNDYGVTIAAGLPTR